MEINNELTRLIDRCRLKFLARHLQLFHYYHFFQVVELILKQGFEASSYVTFYGNAAN